MGLAVVMLALMQVNADAALPSPSATPTKIESHDQSNPPQTIDEESTCQNGLRFGITSGTIPSECDAHLIKELVTETSRREKWQYRKGYLFFDNGILNAIQQTNP